MADRQTDIDPLLDRIRSGDKQAIFDLFERDRNRLRRMVELRMDSRLQTRFDPSFEQLSRTEMVQVLGIREETAARRYFRALKRLKALLIEISDGSSVIRGLTARTASPGPSSRAGS
jgi:hypothetical protein